MERKRKHNMKKQVSLRKAIALGVLAVFACSLVTGLAVYGAVHPSGQMGELYDALKEADSIAEQYFVGEYETEDLIDYTLAGFAEGLGDRWTSYMTPDYYASYLDSTADTTVGIGVTVSYEEDADGSHYLLVNSIAHESPADKAGFGYYDEIVSVDGKTIDELGSYEDAVDAVRGDAGEDVTLGVQRYATGEKEEITVTRSEYDQIHVTSRMLEGNIGYIGIERFTEQTDEQFKKALDDMIDQGAESLVFDLRNNPGGQLTALVNCLDYLLPEGDIISLKNKAGKTSKYTSDANEVDLPMAVIVNSESYSAAEFFAAALQEYGKAEVVGGKTVGKGYSQQGFPLSNGGCLNISTSCYYTPQGVSLIGKGVTPDVAVDLSDEKTERFYVLSDEEDDQLQAAISTLKS
ncbi:MAG: S41 family peptidase [Clostridia bacterium]|nr:S41 family peptidase [Clostridia bacterium]